MIVLETENNNSISTAQNLGAILSTSSTSPNSMSIIGAANASDRDFYRLLKGFGSATLDIELENQSGFAVARVWKDANFNSIADPGEVVASFGSTSTSNGSVKLEAVSDSKYYIEVDRSSGSNISYQLNITATPGAGQEALNGTTDLGNILASRRFNGNLSSTFDTDVYKFHLNTSRKAVIDVSDRPVNMELYRDANFNGQLDSSDPLLATSTTSNSGIGERVSKDLGFGRYLVKVKGNGSFGVGDYRLNAFTLSTTV